MLLRKMLRDMRLNITQFISIFIMSILGALVYSGINAEWYGMKLTVDNYYAERNLPYIWVISSGFSEDDVGKVKNLSGVSAVARRGQFDAAVKVGNSTTLRINIVENEMLSSPQSIEGSEFDVTKDGIWLDASFAEANKLDVGDEIVFEVIGMEIKKKILGLIIHPEYVYSVKDDSSFMPNSEIFGFAFLPSSALLKEANISYNQLLISTDSQRDTKAIIADLENVFTERYNIILDRDTHPSVVMFQSEIEQNKALGGVFPIVFFVIAALSMLTTMTRMTNNQRSQIGVLKALGFSRKSILIHYVSYGLWIGLLGGIIGLISGPLLIPPILFSMQKTIYTLPSWSAEVSPSSFAAVIAAVFCCGASSYFACQKQLKEVPAAALRPIVPRAVRRTALEKSRLWHRLGFSAQWNIRDILRSRIRSVMAVIGVMGCTALLIFGLGLRDTIYSVSSRMYRDLNVYESKINLKKEVQREEISEMEKKYSG